MHSTSFLSNHPTRFLILSFVAWKSLLLLIAAVAPGPGYDTSTGLSGLREGLGGVGQLPFSLRHLLEKLTRWDAIYFVKVANRGYLFEQEWAWGWGYTRALAIIASGIMTCSFFCIDHCVLMISQVSLDCSEFLLCKD